MRKKITPMNTKTLLTHLENGAKLRTHWSYGQRLNILKLPGGETLYVQRSNVDALLKAGKLFSVLFSGDNYEYHLVRDNVQST